MKKNVFLLLCMMVSVHTVQGFTMSCASALFALPSTLERLAFFTAVSIKYTPFVVTGAVFVYNYWRDHAQLKATVARNHEEVKEEFVQTRTEIGKNAGAIQQVGKDVVLLSNKVDVHNEATRETLATMQGHIDTIDTTTRETRIGVDSLSKVVIPLIQMRVTQNGLKIEELLSLGKLNKEQFDDLVLKFAALATKDDVRILQEEMKVINQRLLGLMKMLQLPLDPQVPLLEMGTTGNRANTFVQDERVQNRKKIEELD
jgi:hypothetical protein